MSSSRTCWVVVCAAGVLLAGCDDGPPEPAPATTTAAPKPAKSPASQVPPDMVAAVGSTRNSNAVSVHFKLNGNPTVGQALPVDIAIVPHATLSGVSAHFEVRDGLAVATGDSLVREANPTPEEVIKHQLVLLPSKEGVFMVTALIDTESSDGSTSRIFSIPVIVGAAATAAAPPPSPPPPTPPASTPSG
jgi:hypothetical protein